MITRPDLSLKICDVLFKMETSVVWLKNAFECLMSGDFPTTSDIRFVIKIQVFLSLSKKKTHMACFQIVFTLVPIYFVVFPIRFASFNERKPI